MVHVGTNDIYGRNTRDIDCLTIACDIINIGRKCVAHGVNTVFISSILMTRNFSSNEKVKEINSLLMELCAENDFIYINNILQ